MTENLTARCFAASVALTGYFYRAEKRISVRANSPPQLHKLPDSPAKGPPHDPASILCDRPSRSRGGCYLENDLVVKWVCGSGVLDSF